MNLFKLTPVALLLSTFAMSAYATTGTTGTETTGTTGTETTGTETTGTDAADAADAVFTTGTSQRTANFVGRTNTATDGCSFATVEDGTMQFVVQSATTGRWDVTSRPYVIINHKGAVAITVSAGSLLNADDEAPVYTVTTMNYQHISAIPTPTIGTPSGDTMSTVVNLRADATLRIDKAAISITGIDTDMVVPTRIFLGGQLETVLKTGVHGGINLDEHQGTTSNSIATFFEPGDHKLVNTITCTQS